MLEERGIHSYEFPLVEATNGPDTEKLPAVLQSRKFDWVVLTSPEAASVFVAGWRAAGRPSVRIAVVGKGTARILDEDADIEFLRPAFTPTKANAVHLSAELPLTTKHNEQSSTEQHPPSVLYPASRKAATTLQDALTARGFDVVRLNTYNTVPVATVAPEDLEEAKSCAVVTIASPSACKAWIALVGQSFASSKPLACIGSTSGHAALKAGLPEHSVFWDDDPGMDGFVRSVTLALDA